MFTTKSPPFNSYEMTLIREAMNRDEWTDEKIVRAANYMFSRPWFNRCKNGHKGVAPWIRLKLEEVLRLEPNSLGSQHGQRRKFFGPRSPEEIKDLIVTKAISEQMLGDCPPTFKTCVEHSCVKHPTSIKEKMQPEFLEGMSHFFQPSAILRIKCPGIKGKKLLAYERKPEHPKLQFQMSRGVAVLWAASYRFNEERAHHPMDFWLERVVDRSVDARKLFTQGESCVLLQLLAYKLQPRHLRAADFVPLGVASINLLNTPRKAIYTQYVFTGCLEFTNLPKLKELSLLPVPLKLVDEKENDPENTCIDEKGQPRSLDVLAWQALLSNKSRMEYNNATFRRGFELI